MDLLLPAVDRSSSRPPDPLLRGCTRARPPAPQISSRGDRWDRVSGTGNKSRLNAAGALDASDSSGDDSIDLMVRPMRRAAWGRMGVHGGCMGLHGGCMPRSMPCRAWHARLPRVSTRHRRSHARSEPQIGHTTDGGYGYGYDGSGGAAADAGAYWEPAVADDGTAYWYNTMTGESSWEPPAGYANPVDDSQWNLEV